ncbi:MAG: hypothetical protein JXR83_17395 [Deltaproteobacteria bacterium]|nr:hypothetical protein [Deltaproteobacteria bacterium]
MAALAGGIGFVVGIAGCPDPVPGDKCTTQADCPSGQVCVNGQCVPWGSDSGQLVACTSDEQCQAIDPQMFCNPSGLCDLPGTGTECTVTADCPIDQFCNFQSQVCTQLQPGFCRIESQCNGQRCSATAGGVGRCVDCLTNADCDGGICQSNGTCGASGCVPPCEEGYTCNINQCVPIAGDCNPPCVEGETCVQGVCYGANGCPRHAHPVGDQCACDDGYQPNAAGNACVSSSGECDPQQRDACLAQGGQWDNTNCICTAGGSCNPPCGAGYTCQGTTCVPVTGSCTEDLECLLASGGNPFFACDQTSGTCVCDAMYGMLMCLLFGYDFDQVICDCDYPEETDAGTPHDAGRRDSGGRDAGSADVPRRDAAAPDGNQAQPGQVGAPCTSAGQCTVISDMRCYTDWPGGYCDKECDWDAYEDCGTGALCVCEDLGLLWCRAASCYHLCESNADCRSGYECVEAPNDPVKVCAYQGS